MVCRKNGVRISKYLTLNNVFEFVVEFVSVNFFFFLGSWSMYLNFLKFFKGFNFLLLSIVGLNPQFQPSLLLQGKEVRI